MIPGWVVTVRFSRVDLEDPVHARERDRERTLDPGRAAREPGARAARDDRDVVLAAQPDELRDLGRLVGQRDRERQARRAGTAVSSRR